MPKQKSILTKRQRKQLDRLQQAFQTPTYDQVKQQYLQKLAAQRPVQPNFQAASTPTSYDAFRQMYENAMASLINDAFFKLTPFRAYLKKKGPTSFSGGSFNYVFEQDADDLRDWTEPHIPGHLCEQNLFCEECYS